MSRNYHEYYETKAPTDKSKVSIKVPTDEPENFGALDEVLR